jgi:hypothetical protein
LLGFSSLHFLLVSPDAGFVSLGYYFELAVWRNLSGVRCFHTRRL